ncbi:DUF2523 domain-containing protein [Acidovorax sp. Root70]|uniref:DUF2523 domain-containing protein n=1 Tax=unclassified Acidovorax TaxID=2684926 RepID=UPI0006F318F4|nr:DUF2523 domain-containing protein [Acidovorax sp. Root70]KRB35538.1 cobalt ABC transporter permease [Acidovorax sp. Root70]
MPAFIAALMGALINIAGTLVGRVLIALGMSVVTFTGVSTTLTWAKSNAVSALSALPVEVVGMLSAMGVGEFLSILLSALTARMALQGLTGGAGGSIKRLVVK